MLQHVQTALTRVEDALLGLLCLICVCWSGTTLVRAGNKGTFVIVDEHAAMHRRWRDLRSRLFWPCLGSVRSGIEYRLPTFLPLDPNISDTHVLS